MVGSFIELMAYLKSEYLVSYSIGFTPLHITESYENYSKRYHHQLGWLSQRERVDAMGSRYIPAFNNPEQNKTCVSLYGDSFTEGFGVDHEHAWSNVLSLLLNCRVANYGVSGYGTDQAFLRFLDNRKDQARLVILGYLSENLMRNVNQLRNLISDVPSCHVKPRFILNEQGQLTLVPIPHLTKKQYEDLKTHPEHILHHEFYLPGGLSGYQRQKFPYTWGIIKVFPILFKNMVLRQGTYYGLYQPGNPAQAVEITVAIMEEFCREARKRSQQPLVLIIPTHIDMATYRHIGKWVYQPLTDILTQRQLEFIDVGPKFLQNLGNAKLETLYNPKSQYHLSEKGNWLLAKIVYDYIIRNNFFGNVAHEPSHP
jgi:lysophospholipase L1-like esterase